MSVTLPSVLEIVEPERVKARVATCRVSSLTFVDETGQNPAVTIQHQAIGPDGAVVREWTETVAADELQANADFRQIYGLAYQAVYARVTAKGTYSEDNLRRVIQ
jgi:hypothetical protein